ncbi:head decoration protein [Solidesulfovibrio sp.]
MTILNESYRLPDIVRRELDREFSRENVIFAAGAAIALCAVVGRITKGVPVAAAAAGNTGNGLITDLALGLLAEVGVYRLVCSQAIAGSGLFQVFTPGGLRLEDAVVGAPYASPHLALTIGDGAADFVVGDDFTVTVPAGSGKCTLINPAAVDGSQIAAGISIAAYNAATADVRGVIVAREAVVMRDLLSWPAGITAPQKSKALAELAALGFKLSTGV